MKIKMKERETSMTTLYLLQEVCFMSAEDNQSDFLAVRELSLSNSQLVEVLREMLEKGKSFRFEAKGFSMSPFIKHSDIITVSPLCANPPLKRGDIIAYIHPASGKLVVHRIITVMERYCLVKGDNLDEMDGWIPMEYVLGVIKKVEREGKNIRLGLGPEKYIISAFSKSNILKPLKKFLRPLLFPTNKSK